MFQNHLSNIYRTSQYNFNRKFFLRLDANERVVPFRKKTIEDIKKIIDSNILQSYPSNPKKIEFIISKKENLPSKYINLVPGADSAIKYLFEIFSGALIFSVIIIFIGTYFLTYPLDNVD